MLKMLLVPLFSIACVQSTVEMGGADQLPPPIAPGFVLNVPASASPGDTITVTASLPPGAPRNEVRLMLGLGGLGAGPCLVAPGNPCLDVAGPVRALGAATPVGGQATWTLRLPAVAPLGSYGLQGAQFAGGAWTLTTPVSLNLVAPVLPVCGDGELELGEACVADAILEDLRTDRQGTLVAVSHSSGWPAPVEGGLLFVSDQPGPWTLAGDHSGWTSQPMRADAGFRWRIEPTAIAGGYKFFDGTTWRPDPWARAYDYDVNGEISLQQATWAHIERLPEVGGNGLRSRTLRAWVPGGPVTHVVYAHDGQNLFDPGAIWGGWRMQNAIPAGMMVVGIDNTPDRMDEYTHVVDVIGGSAMGGTGDAYADYVEQTVRPLVRSVWGEPARVGLLGSSLGGLISLHIADRYPTSYDFVASMSGTLGWGSIGASNETILERYDGQGPRGFVVFADSGGNGPCFDSDGDGLEDDSPTAADNYCETRQFVDQLAADGYTWGTDLHHWWEPGAPHNEVAWGDRVFRPLQVFAGL